jgi:hypothetical protein
MKRRIESTDQVEEDQDDIEEEEEVCAEEEEEEEEFGYDERWEEDEGRESFAENLIERLEASDFRPHFKSIMGGQKSDKEITVIRNRNVAFFVKVNMESSLLYENKEFDILDFIQLIFQRFETNTFKKLIVFIDTTAQY